MDVGFPARISSAFLISKVEQVDELPGDLDQTTCAVAMVLTLRPHQRRGAPLTTSSLVYSGQRVLTALPTSAPACCMDSRALERLGHHVVSRRVALGIPGRLSAPVSAPGSVNVSIRSKKPLLNRGFACAPSGFRTPDPLIKSQLLYQLS